MANMAQIKLTEASIDDLDAIVQQCTEMYKRNNMELNAAASVKGTSAIVKYKEIRRASKVALEFLDRGLESSRRSHKALQEAIERLHQADYIIRDQIKRSKIATNTTINIATCAKIEDATAKKLIAIMLDIDQVARFGTMASFKQKRGTNRTSEYDEICRQVRSFTKARRACWERTIMGLQTEREREGATTIDGPQVVCSDWWTVDTGTDSDSWSGTDDTAAELSGCRVCDLKETKILRNNLPLINCSSARCPKRYCQMCMVNEKKRQKELKFPWVCFYCSDCAGEVNGWIIEAKKLHADDAKFQKLVATKMPMDTIADENVWTFYLQFLFDRLQLLPLSCHPDTIHIQHEDSTLYLWAQDYRNKDQIFGNTTLRKMVKETYRQFDALECDHKPAYEAQLQVSELATITKEYKKDTIKHMTYENMKMLRYVLTRKDFHSRLKLVRTKMDNGNYMYSVVTTGFIAKGTCVTPYGGCCYKRIQISDEIATCSCTMTLLEHKNDEDATVVIQPYTVSNYARFINGLRPEDQRKANIALATVNIDEVAQIMMVAIRDIEAGEHLYYFYGTQYDADDFLPLTEFLNLEWEQF